MVTEEQVAGVKTEEEEKERDKTVGREARSDQMQETFGRRVFFPFRFRDPRDLSRQRRFVSHPPETFRDLRSSFLCRHRSSTDVPGCTALPVSTSPRPDPRSPSTSVGTPESGEQ